MTNMNSIIGEWNYIFKFERYFQMIKSEIEADHHHDKIMF